MDYKFAHRYDGLTGSAIRNIFALLADPSIISFAGGNPSPATFPSSSMATIAEEMLKREGASILQYGGTVGRADLLESVKGLFEKEGLTPSTQELIITSGSSQAIDLMTRSFIDKGDVILVESPTFLGSIQTFKLYQAQLVEVDMDEEAMDLADLEAKIKKYSPKFVYTIPTFQNPSGKTMSDRRRKTMYEICEKYGVMILEDDPYWQLRYEGEHQKPIKYYDKSDIVVKLMSFSKIISPGLRVGAAYAHPDIIAKFNMGKQGQDVHTANLNQAMVNEYIIHNLLQPHIEEICEYYKSKWQLQNQLAQQYLPKGTKIAKAQGGMFLWAELPEQYNSTEIFKKAVAAKVAYVPGTHFYADGGHHNTLRLNFTMVDEDKIEKGMKTLGQVFAG